MHSRSSPTTVDHPHKWSHMRSSPTWGQTHVGLVLLETRPLLRLSPRLLLLETRPLRLSPRLLLLETRPLRLSPRLLLLETRPMTATALVPKTMNHNDPYSMIPIRTPFLLPDYFLTNPSCRSCWRSVGTWSSPKAKTLSDVQSGPIICATSVDEDHDHPQDSFINVDRSFLYFP